MSNAFLYYGIEKVIFFSDTVHKRIKFEKLKRKDRVEYVKRKNNDIKKKR